MEQPPSVLYIPSQLYAPGSWADPDPLMLRDSPLRLLWKDLKHGVTQLAYFVYIFLPLKSGRHGNDKRGELHFDVANFADIGHHVLLFFISFGMLSLGLLIWLFSSGLFLAVYYSICWLVIGLICWLVNYGPRVLESEVDLRGFPARPGEKWIFVNGICAGTRWLQGNIDLLSTIFGRPVIGIHNRTSGVLFDLLECIIQRDFLYGTNDVRTTYNYIKRALLDSENKKVVIIAHSQGGIIVSSVIDALYTELVPAALDKIEIYTFGCAANHFSNPVRCTACGHGSCTSHLPTLSLRRQIAIIEHYANEKDFVARIGVLRFTRGQTSAFVGKVFTRLGQGGHVFNQHYLLPMFDGEDPEFLKSIVQVEEVDTELGQVAAEGGGKTMKELSRLWKYRGGQCPDTEVIRHQRDRSISLPLV